MPRERQSYHRHQRESIGSLSLDDSASRTWTLCQTIGLDLPIALEEIECGMCNLPSSHQQCMRHKHTASFYGGRGGYP